MSDVHWLYTYGPFAFIGLSAVTSAILAPRATRRIGARRHAKYALRMGLDPKELPAFKPSPTLAVAGLAGTLITFWGIGTLLCFLVLTSARSGALAPGEPLPGSTFDAYVVAHMAPPLSKRVALAMIRRLDARAETLRYEAGSPLELRLGHAAWLDPHPDDAVSRWVRHHFRTRAGKVALANPSVAACSAGFDAFADSLREGAVMQLAQACRNVRGDTGARAAFKVGDYRNASGPETEAILSRLPFPPASEPGCFAGGDAVPPNDLPLCRLLHAEVKKEARGDILPTLEVAPEYARRWLAAMRMSRGGHLRDEDRFAIDPELLLLTPLAAIADQPIAVHLDLSSERLEKLSSAEATSVDVILAAHRSAFGDHGPAKQRCDRALAAASSLAPDEEAAVRRTCAVVWLRSGEPDRAREVLEAGDSLLVLADAIEDGVIDPRLAEQLGLGATIDLDGPALARMLSTEDGARLVRRGALHVLLQGKQGEPALQEWLREGFPACARCDFFDQLEMLLLRRDAAEVMGDQAVMDDLTPILERYRGVFENRPLGLILRAGRAD